MTNNELNRTALEWFEAFNQHDLEKLLRLYHEEAEHYSPKLKVKYPETLGLIKGKEALRNWWQEAFERLPSLQYKMLHLISHENRVFMDYIRQVDNEEDLRVGETLEINDGLIVASRVYHS
ncbi:MAG: nuclear transport factor 2 family protein [Cyclobacteriaceae bacterium]|nr:nuclear transport factor 2 family protein [Cyclobacteriaceae bacterium]